MPIGSRHRFKNESGQPTRMLITIAPAGLEEMFLEVGEFLSSEADQPSPPTAEDIERLLEAAPRYGLEIFPPSEKPC
ncbi:cupin domain-containing protein [Blastopirellula retiformator]|uniref:Cupin domain protein n=1 Tax=Blastopirellula retiformator TaxID=2527970 RepID=A0A5C5V1C6_9BACT|nr:hypothetical protein [Blastopirellula retiformator]TWT31809.1 hypothetical protein Enr8_37340 [Blastopirellula retiformator]